MADQGLFLRLRFRGESDPVSVLDALLSSGWKSDDDGRLRYLPLGDEDYNWTVTSASDLPRVFAEIRTKARNGETIGVVLTFGDTATGGEWLLLPNGDVAFTPSVNRRTTQGRTDVGWYLERVWPALLGEGAFDVESWRWEECL